MARPCVPHPGNAPGDFFIEDNCCTRCEVIFTIAPDLFGVDNTDSHCVVKRQPQTSDELERMYQSIEAAELDCIHYKGANRVIAIQVHEARTGMRGVSSDGWWTRLLRQFKR